jgi:hypothetical protein
MFIMRRCLVACCVAAALTATGDVFGDPTSVAELSSQIFAYLDEPDAALAEQRLQQVLGRADATVPDVRRIIEIGRSYGAQRVGTMPDESILVRDRSYHYALSVPSAYEPANAYGLVVCLHGAGFTGEAYLDRWQSRLGDAYVLVCPTYPAGAWYTRRAEELVLAVIRAVQVSHRSRSSLFDGDVERRHRRLADRHAPRAHVRRDRADGERVGRCAHAVLGQSAEYARVYHPWREGSGDAGRSEPGHCAGTGGARICAHVSGA